MSTDLQVAPQAAIAPVSPMDLLQLAINREGSIDVIERLAKLQMEMMDRDAKVAFTQAFEEFRRNVPPIVKDSAIIVNQQERGKYAKLDKICGVLNPALLQVGITTRWKTRMADNGNVLVTCFLRHRLGHEEEGSTLGAAPDNSGSKNAVQACGSTVSYLERYTLVASCGIAIKDQDNVDSGTAPEDVLDIKEYAPLMDAIQGAGTVGEVTAAYIRALKASKNDVEKTEFEAAAKKRKEELK